MNTGPRTLYQKLVDSHTVVPLDTQNVLLFCDLHLMNEYTNLQAFAGLHEKGREVAMPGQNVSTVSLCTCATSGSSSAFAAA